MLTRSIENAQKKVEGRNFDIRKHVLQYDDVVNKQRTVIYDERRRILHGESLKEQTYGFIRKAVERVVSEHSARTGRHFDVDLAELLVDVQQNFPLYGISTADFESKEPEELSDFLEQRVLALYEQKETEVGRAVLRTQFPDITEEMLAAKAREIGALQMREIERVITLKAIDEQWIDHLNMLDHLRSGVSLRGYGQQDPVVVYAQEAFDEFDNLKERIQLDVIRKVFLVRVQEPKVERVSAYNIRGAGRAVPGTVDETGKRIAEKRLAPKIGRNMKCYCGSGKKYKQCHLPQDGGNPPEDWSEQYIRHYGEVPVG
jgi:preprotein translocase subunit SecA